MERKRPDHGSTQKRVRKILHNDYKIQPVDCKSRHYGRSKKLVEEKYAYKAKANDIELELMKRRANGEETF